MHYIINQFVNDVYRLNRCWREDVYIDMEAIRKSAQNSGHCLEEAAILFYENRYFRERHEDDEKYLATVVRLNEISVILDKDDDYFRNIYGNMYPLQNRLSRWYIDFGIRYVFNKIDGYADYFAGNMAFKTVQLCGKVMQKIAVVSPGNVNADQIMETHFVRAIAYGNIRDFRSAFHCYDQAIEKAQETEDKAYLYIALMRKLSICNELAQFDSQTDFDLEKTECVRLLNGMMTEKVNNVDELGNMLVQEEIKKKRNAPSKEKDYYRKRINKIKEALPMLSMQLAMSRGDSLTSGIHLEKLKEEERRAYGCNPEISSADMIGEIYSTIFNSPEKEEHEEENNVEIDLSEYDGVTQEFPKDMIPWYKFTNALMWVRNSIILKMFKTAEYYCGYLLELAEDAKSDYHKAIALNEYGQTLEIQQKTEMAVKAYKNALHLLENADLTVSDADLSPYLYYNLQCEIGRLLIGSDPESSVDYFTKAMQWLEKHRMSQMLFMEHILNGRADAYRNLGKKSLADKDRTDFLKFAENETRRRIMFLDSDSREIFWNDTSSRIYNTVSHISADSDECFRIEAYNAVLLSKGMLLSSERSVKEAVSEDLELKRLYEELEKNESNRKQWGTSDSVEEYTEAYLKSMRLVSELEKTIPDNDGFLHTGFDDIKKALGENEILVDYFDYGTENGDRQYIAFVLKHDYSAPEVVELCRESELASFFEAQKESFEGRKEVNFSVIYEPLLEASHQLEEMIWKPIEVRCGILPENRIKFVPSGSLHKVAVESLPFGKSWSLTLSDRYSAFTRLSHARSLLSTRHDSEKKTVAIFADPDYGAAAPQTSKGMKGYSVTMSDGTPEAVPWEQLRDAGSEVDQLQTLFVMAGWETDVYTGKDADVKHFSAIDGQSPTILHISTHGFAETKKSAKNIPALSSYHRPLDLTGIVLANGNEGWMNGSRHNHPGIVLASNIARMDLSGSETVFVSCCLSGEGIVKPDGIYGIQRALKKAGTGTIIMSLWAESEDSGKLFAREFYSSCLYGNDKHTAFSNAKRKVREQTKDPYLWAGFIMLD